MRKPVTFRFDCELLERARQHASADNRSLTNYVETAVLRALGQSEFAGGEPVPATGPKLASGGIDN